MSTQQVGRLAMRVEGDWWVAYYAVPNSMKNAVLLGKIHMRFVQQNHRKTAFMELMREAVGDILEDITGERPIWPFEPQQAPEHERSGRA